MRASLWGGDCERDVEGKERGKGDREERKRMEGEGVSSS